MGESVRNSALITACLLAAIVLPAAASQTAKAHKTVPAGTVAQKPTPKTYVYIPAILPDGKGFVAQFVIDDDGNLDALKPPIVSTGAYPYSVAVDPSGQYCYAALWTDPGAISGYAIRPDGALASLTVPPVHTGREPYPIAFTPDGRLAVVPNNEDGTIGTYRLDGNGGMTLASTLSTGKESRSVTVDRSGAFVYAANYDSDSISIYALTSNGDLAQVTTVDTGKLPYDVALSPSGRFLYSADRRSGDVMVFAVSKADGALRLVSDTPSGTGSGSGANWIAFDSQGKFAYVTNYSEGTVSQFIVDAGTGQLTRNGDDVKVGSVPIQVAIDPSDQFAYVANSGDNTVSQLRIRRDGTLSTGASVRIHGQAETQTGGVIHLTGSPWTIAFVRK